MNAILVPKWLMDANVNATLPIWFRQMQQEQWEKFTKIGLPSYKNERYKYTDFSFLETLANVHTDSSVNQNEQKHHNKLKFMSNAESYYLPLKNGTYEETSTTLKDSGIIATSLRKALIEHEWLFKTYPFQFKQIEAYPLAIMNSAFFLDGLFLYIPDGCKLSLPLHLLTYTTPDQNVAYLHYKIILGAGAELTLLDEYRSEFKNIMNIVLDIHVSENASFIYYKLQNEQENSKHIANIFIKQAKNSHVHCFNFSKGSQFSRDDLVIVLDQKEATCRALGFSYLQNNSQYIDHHIDIIHKAPHTSSEMLYKTIIESKARAVFNGKLYVDKHAQKIVAYQANHNLLLSSNAEVFSKPELEIYADDVQCKHGATTGQIDTEALFYLRSRGIEQDEAISLLLQAFAKEVLDQVKERSVQTYLLMNGFQL